MTSCCWIVAVRYVFVVWVTVKWVLLDKLILNKLLFNQFQNYILPAWVWKGTIRRRFWRFAFWLTCYFCLIHSIFPIYLQKAEQTQLNINSWCAGSKTADFTSCLFFNKCRIMVSTGKWNFIIGDQLASETYTPHVNTHITEVTCTNIITEYWSYLSSFGQSKWDQYIWSLTVSAYFWAVSSAAWFIKSYCCSC